MSGNLKTGTKLRSENNIEYEVIKLLGSGGQGEVYKVNGDGEKYALKWYYPHTATEIRLKILDNLISKGSPGECFLWPKDIVKKESVFGYIMDLRPSNFNSMFDLLSRKVETTFEILCLSGFNIAKEYHKLHSAGWCYIDISWGNIFIDFKKGDALICDNDNAIPNRSKLIDVGGTPGFIAPELLLGKAKPSTNTDLYSLAVLLFYLLNIHHPLEGKLESDIEILDLIARNKLYGENPVFIWDPDDKSNRPIPVYQQNAIEFWKVYPKFLKDRFIHAFTVGLKNPQKRSTETDWQITCIRLLNSLYRCADKNCGKENFFDFAKHRLGVAQTCWKCQKTIPIPTMLKIEQDHVMLHKNAKLYQHHSMGDYRMDIVIGEMNQNLNNPNLWGIKNLSNNVWSFVKPDSQNVMVGQGKTLPLIKGGKINFGSKIGEII